MVPPPPSTTGETLSSAELNQLEEKNKALLKQIINLQKERDFYKKKITEWTQAQLEEQPKEPVRPETPKPSPPAAALPGYVMPYSTDLLDSLLEYRKRQLARQVPPSPKISYEDSLFKAADRYAKTERYLESLRTYEQLIASGLASDRHYLEYGKLLYKFGRYRPALAMLTRVAGDENALAETAYYKARIYQEIHALHRAEIDLYRYQHYWPGDIGYTVGLAYQQLHEGHLDSARHLWQTIRKAPSQFKAEIYTGLGRIAQQQANSRIARRYFQQALVHDPLYIENSYSLGNALFQEGEYQTAVLFLKPICAVYRDSNAVYSLLGQAFYYMKQWERALENFSHCDDSPAGVEIRRQWIPKIYYIRSLLAKERGDYRRATDNFREARKWDPNATRWMVASLEDMGRIYERDADYNDALSYYAKAIRLNPNDGETFLNIGKFFYRIGELDEARKYLSRAEQKRATAARARYWLDQLSGLN